MVIPFEVTQNGYTLRDALHLPDDHTLTDAEIEQMKQTRFDNWYAILTDVPPETITDIPPEVGV